MPITSAPKPTVATAKRDLSAALTKHGLAPKTLANAREITICAKALLDAVTASPAAVQRKPAGLKPTPAATSAPTSSTATSPTAKELWAEYQAKAPGPQRRAFFEAHKHALWKAARELTPTK